MSTAKTYPKTWPGTAIIKSLHTPFNWRRDDMDPRPLNAGIQPTAEPRRTGPKTLGGLAKNNGTIRALSPRAEKLLALRPTHVGFVIPKPGTTARVRTIDGKTISKVVNA